MEATTKKYSKNLTNEFYEFIYTHNPKIVSRHLRNVFLSYITSQGQSGLPLDFEKYLYELSDLFQLLDNAEDFFDNKS